MLKVVQQYSLQSAQKFANICKIINTGVSG